MKKIASPASSPQPHSALLCCSLAPSPLQKDPSWHKIGPFQEGRGREPWEVLGMLVIIVAPSCFFSKVVENAGSPAYSLFPQTHIREGMWADCASGKGICHVGKGMTQVPQCVRGGMLYFPSPQSLRSFFSCPSLCPTAQHKYFLSLLSGIMLGAHRQLEVAVWAQSLQKVCQCWHSSW